MKNLLLLTVLGGGLVLPPNKTAPPVALASVPATIQPQPQIAIIPAAIVIGIGVGVVGIGAVKAIDRILNVWERKVTNNVPDGVVFTWAEDEYPQ